MQIWSELKVHLKLNILSSFIHPYVVVPNLCDFVSFIKTRIIYFEQPYITKYILQGDDFVWIRTMWFVEKRNIFRQKSKHEGPSLNSNIVWKCVNEIIQTTHQLTTFKTVMNCDETVILWNVSLFFVHTMEVNGNTILQNIFFLCSTEERKSYTDVERHESILGWTIP